MLDGIIGNLSLPFEIMKVFDSIKDIFNALPLAVKFAIIACFSVACLFAVIKMLF